MEIITTGFDDNNDDNKDDDNDEPELPITEIGGSQKAPLSFHPGFLKII